MVIKSIILHGLDPSFGLFHHNRGNLYALADDFIEPFRPLIDEQVYSLYKMNTYFSLNDKNIKRGLVAAADGVFGEEGFRVSTVIDKFVAGYVRYLRGDNTKLEIPVWLGKYDG